MAKRTKKDTSRRNLVVGTNPSSVVSEQFRSIRTNIMYAGVGKDITAVLFTSDTPVAGKSTVAANMAVAYAQAGKKTLLLDADLRRPTCHHTFEVPNKVGLSTAIVNEIPVSQVISKTTFNHLDLLTSGPVPPNPAELLSVSKFDAIMVHLKTEYDMVIIDSPPILSVTDAQLLSKNADGVILVTNVEKNNRDRLNEAIELLRKSSANIIGIVLNQRMKKSKKEDYRYFYEASADA